MAQTEQTLDAQHLPEKVLQLRKEQESELEELDSLVKQTAVEIERLLPEKNDVGRKLRELESGIDNFSRSDIRRMYSIAQEVSLRLNMMQSRMEQLQYKQKVLQRTLTHFDQVVAAMAATAGTSDVERIPITGPDVLRALIDARESERRAVARELQDFAAQTLSSLVLRAQICERAVEVDQARARDELRLLREALADKLQSTRLLIFELHPQVLDDLGLVATLRRYVHLVDRSLAMSRIAEPSADDDGKAGPPVLELGAVGLDRRYPPAVEIGAFRVAQEAIQNAIRHSRASRVGIDLEDEGSELVVSVSDNGIGFNADAALANARKKQTGGLANVSAEAEALGAALSIESEPGRGTKLRLAMPL